MISMIPDSRIPGALCCQSRDPPGSHAQTWLLLDALSHGSANGNRAIKSWILSKPGFLSNIVRETLIQFTLFPSDKKEPKQMGSLGTTVCHELLEMDFFVGGRVGEQKKETEKTDLVRNHLSLNSGGGEGSMRSIWSCDLEHVS